MEWENDLLRSLDCNNAIIYVAEHQGHIMGVIVGGVMGLRGTINHLIVAVDFRSQGAGATLTATLLKDFENRNMRRTFLFCKQESPANHFWLSHNFKGINDEWTYEIDL